MKITLENPFRMVLKDYNYTAFFLGLIVLVGSIAQYMFLSKSLGIVAVLLLTGPLIGLWMIGTFRTVIITLDKTLGKGNFSSRSIIGGQKSIDIYLNKIKKLILYKISQRGIFDNYNYYMLAFVMDTDKWFSIKLAHVCNSIVNAILPSNEKQKSIQQAQQVAGFLRVPLEIIIEEGMVEKMEKTTKVNNEFL